MPAPKSPEFRRRAVELARLRERPIAQIARELQISESCLRRWLDQADVDDGHKPGLTKDERAELVKNAWAEVLAGLAPRLSEPLLG
jgi:transposase